MHGLSVDVNSFCMVLISRNLCGFLLIFLTGFTSLGVLFLFPLSITFFFMHSFDSISSNIDDVLSINPSANIFVFGEFNVHHKEWLTYSGGTDRPGELCYNFSVIISNDLTQMVTFPTPIPDCDSHSVALLDLFISSDSIICSTMAFPPMGNSDVVVSVSIDFRTHPKQDNHFITQLMTILLLIGIAFVII